MNIRIDPNLILHYGKKCFKVKVNNNYIWIWHNLKNRDNYYKINPNGRFHTTRGKCNTISGQEIINYFNEQENKMNKMNKIEKLQKLLNEEFTNEWGNVVIEGLNIEGNFTIKNSKFKKDLRINGNIINEDSCVNDNAIGRDSHSSDNEINGNSYASGNAIVGDSYANRNTIVGDSYSTGNKIGGNLYFPNLEDYEVKVVNSTTNKYTKIKRYSFENMTKEEILKQLGE